MTNVAPGPLSPRRPPRLLVVGCGGIGGILAAHLFEQGHDVTALTTNPLVASAINEHGFRVRGDGSPGTVRGRAVRDLAPSTVPFDFVLLATQPPQVEEAARAALTALAPGGAMVCFQNGLCEERVARIAGAERTLGAIVAWGASMVEPGVYDRTSSGGFVLGSLHAPVTMGETPKPPAQPATMGEPPMPSRLDELAQILEAVGPTTITDNLAGARWSKLAINCAISSLGALGGERLGVLLRHRFVRRLALELMTETVSVARGLGVRLEKVAGTLDLSFVALTDAERASAGSPGLVAKHALLLAVGARYRRLRSSMLGAIERGRPPAVDFLNGEVVARGAALGVATPVNAAIREDVLAIARGGARPGIELLRSFYERTRALGGPRSWPSAPLDPPYPPGAMAATEPAPPTDPAHDVASGPEPRALAEP